MSIVIPSHMRGGVFDLESTLTYPVYINPELEGETKQVPCDGALEFLNRCCLNWGDRSALIFTTAGFGTCADAFLHALVRHPALRAGMWVSNVNKISFQEFALKAEVALIRHRVPDKRDLLYIDDNPKACFNAARFGFGLVICLNTVEKICEILVQIDYETRVAMQAALDGGLFLFANSLNEIIFE